MITLPIRRMSSAAFAPASVANVAVGFDLLGYAVDGIGDTVHVRVIAEPTVKIAAITGSACALPCDPSQNTAGVALQAFRHALALPYGYEIVIEKGIPLSSGMGGSAASCVAALFAANDILEKPLAPAALYPFALDGEAVASGSRHGDNVGPMLLGGFVLSTLSQLIPLQVPASWWSLLVHPDMALETRQARQLLAEPYALIDIVGQTTGLALVLLGCQQARADWVQSGLNDVLIEPRRAQLIPGFAAAKDAALAAGALGSGIAGAGPSVFAWFDNQAQAQAAAPAVQAAFAEVGLSSQFWLTTLRCPGARTVTFNPHVFPATPPQLSCLLS